MNVLDKFFKGMYPFLYNGSVSSAGRRFRTAARSRYGKYKSYRANRRMKRMNKKRMY